VAVNYRLIRRAQVLTDEALARKLAQRDQVLTDEALARKLAQRDHEGRTAPVEDAPIGNPDTGVVPDAPDGPASPLPETEAPSLRG
jgi:hypothetical protein